jgi:hypothetical protein
MGSAGGQLPLFIAVAMLTFAALHALVQGYADLAAGLEKVSEAKGAVDEAKGHVLQVNQQDPLLLPPLLLSLFRGLILL